MALPWLGCPSSGCSMSVDMPPASAACAKDLSANRLSWPAWLVIRSMHRSALSSDGCGP